MSDISKELLKSSHKGVHEQFDLLASVMQVQILLQSDVFYSEVEGASPSKIKKWIKEKATIRMRELGHSPWFLQKRLLVYVFELYEPFYEEYRTILPFKEETTLIEVQYSILILAANFLDNQFSEKRMADICSFLEQDLRQALP
ncbi:MAG TPA: hypothetical protein VLZ29_09080 [Sulfurimonas sp.]|uniref:hypothetical protein n=1 Tax=Sulfurimonas sp. TaxID=2022749 RepID=UPI002B878D26|nr:hypothetical protein [Sulfurimonas sp.]HUH43259.1 hypothetical protein [Sulfurimonas sp.]